MLPKKPSCESLAASLTVAPFLFSFEPFLHAQHSMHVLESILSPGTFFSSPNFIFFLLHQLIPENQPPSSLTTHFVFVRSSHLSCLQQPLSFCTTSRFIKGHHDHLISPINKAVNDDFNLPNGSSSSFY